MLILRVFRRALCYSEGMKFSSKLIVRKVLLAAVVGVAVLLLGDVFQRWTRPRAEEVLAQLHAEKVMVQSLTVNGRALVAELWRLPETSSAAPLRKAGGKALVVGKLVYLFQGDELTRSRGACTYPQDFPALALACDYVVEAGLAQYVTGRTRSLPEAVSGELAASAQAAGWEAVGAGVWKRGGEVLVAQISEREQETYVALMKTKE